MSDYYNLRRLSNSGMTSLARSPAHYQQMLIDGIDSPALRFGRMFHTYVLEPHLVNFSPFDGDRRTKAGKEDFLKIIEAGREPVSADDYEAIIRMGTAVQKTGLIHGSFEVEMLWEDSDSGAEMKGKADIIGQNGIIWDLKTTTDAADFAYSIKKYAYARQAAVYLDGARACGHDVNRFGWIVVEKTAPFGVRVIIASEQTISEGRAAYKPLAALYARCCITGEWPGYQSEFSDCIEII